MDQNDREQVWEVAINCVDHTRKSKVQGGDIVVCRKPRGEIGRKEAHRCVWLRVKGLTALEVETLTESVTYDDRLKDKRRFCVPFAKLKKALPDFDEVKARNPAYFYQPQIGDHETRYRMKEQADVIDLRGCIYDKTRQRFL